MKLVNTHILLSYNKVFNDNKSIENIIKNKIRINHLLLFSTLSFGKYHEVDERMRKWSFSHIKEVINKKELYNNYIIGRHQKLITLKYLLIYLKNQNKTENYNKDLKITYKLFLKVNDIEVDIGTINHAMTNAFLLNYQDNYISQFKRTIDIFLSNSFEVYREVFFKFYKVSIKDYIYVIFYLVSYYNQKRVNYEDTKELKNWGFNLNTNPIAKPKKDIFEKVLNLISFTIEEGRKFSIKTLNDNYNFDLFRNKPLCKLDNGIYLPIDGFYTENLLFHNLFYKILDILEEKKERTNFMSSFGIEFENYISNLVEFSSLKKSYRYIPEFSFKYKRNELKSPDAFLFDEEENILLVVEVKSARVLNTVSDIKESDDSIEKSYEKIRLKPWEQLYTAMTRIIGSIKEKDIIKDKKINNKMKSILEKNPQLMFLSVSMTDIPMSTIQHIVKVSKENKDGSKAFFSMNIEAFEIFIKLISSNINFSFSQILGGYNEYKEEMSIKTYFTRIEKEYLIQNEEFDKIFLESQKDYVDYMSNL